MAEQTDEIVVKLTAQIGELKAGMQSAADSVASANAQMTASSAEASTAMNAAAVKYVAALDRVKASAVDMRIFQGIAQGAARNMAQLGVQEAALDRLMKAGAISTLEYDDALTALNEEEVSIAAATAMHTAALEGNTAATVENAAAQGALNTTMVSGNATREYGALLDEALRGRYRQMIGTSAVLANRMNLLRYAFTPLGAAVIGGVAALGGLVAISVEASNRLSKLDDAVLATGGSAGVTGGDMLMMANRIAGTVGTIGVATDALHDLAMSGRFSGDELEKAGQAAVDMAELTGEKVSQTSKIIESFGDDAAKSAVKVNAQFHFLTLAQYDQINALQQVGDQAGATKLAVQDFYDAMHPRALEAIQDTNVLSRAWTGVKNAVDRLGQSINIALGGGSTAEKLAYAKEQLEKANFASRSMWEQNVKDLQTELLIEQTRAKYKAKQDEINQAAIQGRQTIEATAKSLKDISVTEQEIAKNKAALEAIHTANPNDAALKGMSFQGNVLVGGPAWEKLKSDLQKKFDSHDFMAHVQLAPTDVVQPPQQITSALPAIFPTPVLQNIDLNAMANEQLRMTQGAERVDAALKKVKESAANEVIAVNQIFGVVGSAFDQTVKGVIRGTETWGMGIRKMGRSIEEEFLNMTIRMGMHWLAMEATKSAASIAGDQVRTASAVESADTAAAAEIGGAIKTILAKAWQAASAVYASVSDIPFVGWILAPALAVAAGIEVAGFVGRIASAAGGWENVPGDQMAMVHKNEMVLPAPLAQAARDTFRGGGRRGGDTHVHVNAMDSYSMERAFRKNPGAMMSGIRHAVKMGHRP